MGIVMDLLPSTPTRVPLHTDEVVNEQICSEIARTIDRYRTASRGQLDARLAELDAEWDIERLLEANAASLVIIGTALGRLVNRRWYSLPTLVGVFLLQHAVQGWCPPVPVFRRLGFRTAREIGYERYALKLLRGDFERLQRRNADALLDAVVR
jgi:hypothetical protein